MNLDLERRLADGEAAITLAIIRWVHACCDVTVDRYAWYRTRWTHVEGADASAAENFYNAAVKCAHEAHELARLLDARDLQRAVDLQQDIDDAVAYQLEQAEIESGLCGEEREY